MTERNTFVTVANGDQLNQGYFNGALTAVSDTSTGHSHDGVDSTDLQIHRKQFSNTAEVTNAGAGNVEVVTGTFGALNGLLIGMIVKCKLKTSGTDSSGIVIKLTGANLGTLYINVAYLTWSDSSTDKGRGSVLIGDAGYALKGQGGTYLDYGFTINPLLKLLDASTTLTVELDRVGNSDTVYCDDFYCDLIYVKEFIND